MISKKRKTSNKIFPFIISRAMLFTLQLFGFFFFPHQEITVIKEGYQLPLPHALEPHLWAAFLLMRGGGKSFSIK